MTVNSKDKGRRGEIQIAHILQEHGYDAHRTAQYCGKNGGVADVVGIPGFHLEVKFQEKMHLYDWYAQAVRDSAETGETPVVVHRASRKPWLVSLALDDFLFILNELRTCSEEISRQSQLEFMNPPEL